MVTAADGPFGLVWPLGLVSTATHRWAFVFARKKLKTLLKINKKVKL